MNPGDAWTLGGYATGAAAMAIAAKRKGLFTEGVGIVAVASLIGGVIGASMTQSLVSGSPQLMGSGAGKSLFGGLIVGWICAEIAKKVIGLKRSLGDLYAFGLPAGEAIGRIGCYYYGCCYGKTCDLAWSVYQHEADRHPSQIYSSISSLLVLGVITWLSTKSLPEGSLFRAYLILFGFTRFFIEFTRESDKTYGGLTSMQWFCIELAISGAILIYLKQRKLQKAEQ